MEITAEIFRSHGLSEEEYQEICRLLGRAPNLTELGIFSVMWSEHCSYKSSRLHLKKLPSRADYIIEGPGENAGVVDIGGGLAAVFKIESHNHPSFIEPYQGAATGVGGIIRDIFTMGARPIALLDSLHFGPVQENSNQLIMEGVVSGIAGYGNSIGIPTVGGELHFEERFAHNPIVNVFCLGVAPVDRIFRARASGPGNPVIYAGARTGRDGIHGATMASEQFGTDSEAKRPTVQVGDPFLEKLLLEASLEAMASGAVLGIQDMGAAGLTCSTCEMGSRAGTGIEIELDRVPQRETGMSPYEIMLSESQERMLLVVQKGREDEVLEIFRKWDLEAVVIGRVTSEPCLRVRAGGRTVAEIPTEALTEEAPCCQRRQERPRELEEIAGWRDLDCPEPEDYGAALLQLAASPHLSSRRWVYQQYDYMVRTDTLVGPGADAAVLRLKGRRQALAMSLDGNSRHCYLDPRMGARMAVAESCRNLVVCGARPLAATNCLNFGNPERPGVMWQFVEAVEGMAEACRLLGTPVTGGNVSFYNETEGRAIFPTPVVGMVGRIEDAQRLLANCFQAAGDRVYLLGKTEAELGGSIYLEVRGFPLAGPSPRIDLAFERELHERLLGAQARGLLRSAHDLAEGGLAMGLVECALGARLGARIEIQTPLRADHFLFSETPSRVLVTLAPAAEPEFLELVSGLPCTLLGEVAGEELRVRVNGRTRVNLPLARLFRAWDGSLEAVFRT